MLCGMDQECPTEQYLSIDPRTRNLGSDILISSVSCNFWFEREGRQAASRKTATGMGLSGGRLRERRPNSLLAFLELGGGS